MKVLRSNWFVVLLFLIICMVVMQELLEHQKAFLPVDHSSGKDSAWQAPSTYLDGIGDEEQASMILYGEELIKHTSRFLGPAGSVRQISNGMNCQNCHLNAGKKVWGNNYGAVASTYPKFRERSGTVESMAKRINDCFERSLNGQPLDSNSHEMKSIIVYMNWLGKDVPKGKKPYGTGIKKLPYLERAADSGKGRMVYMNHCQSCHGTNGEGQPTFNGSFFSTPPLWGPHSYNDGAGLFRLSNFAGFVKYNMPFQPGSHASTILTEEEAWDVAAFVNSRPRPHKDQAMDWPDISKKPVDFPFGLYADTFSEQQHKFGPFRPIEEAGKH